MVIFNTFWVLLMEVVKINPIYSFRFIKISKINSIKFIYVYFKNLTDVINSEPNI